MQEVIERHLGQRNSDNDETEKSQTYITVDDHSMIKTSTPKDGKTSSSYVDLGEASLVDNGRKMESMTTEEYEQMLKEKEDFLRNGQNDAFEGCGRKYVITQQEIIFYLKDSDGVLRIVHRPLVSKAEYLSDSSDSENKRRRRRNSQPDLRIGMNDYYKLIL